MCIRDRGARTGRGRPRPGRGRRTGGEGDRRGRVVEGQPGGPDQRGVGGAGPGPAGTARVHHAGRAGGPDPDPGQRFLRRADLFPARARGAGTVVGSAGGGPGDPAHLAWMDSLGPSQEWVAGVPAAKVSHLSAQIHDLNAADMADLGVDKRVALLVCLLHMGRIRARDDLAEMLCKRMAAIHRNARARFETLRETAREQTEHLVDVFGDVLAAVRESMEATGGELAEGVPEPVDALWRRTGQAVLSTLTTGGGVAALSASHEEVSAFHGGNYLPFLERCYRSSRSVLFDLLEVLDLTATTADASVLDAVAFLRAGRRRTGEYIPDHLDGVSVDLSFASNAWQQILRDQRRRWCSRLRPGPLPRPPGRSHRSRPDPSKKVGCPINSHMIHLERMERSSG